MNAQSGADLRAHADQVERARAAEARAKAAEQLQAATQIQLDLARDEIAGLTVERDYFRAIAGDLATRAQMIEEAAHGMLDKASAVAKTQVADLRKLEREVPEEERQQEQHPEEIAQDGYQQTDEQVVQDIRDAISARHRALPLASPVVSAEVPAPKRRYLPDNAPKRR